MPNLTDHKPRTLIMVISFLLSLVLSVCPLSTSLTWWRPDWCFLMIMYWMLWQPETLSVFWVMLIGLALDTVTGSLLGIHGLSFLIIYFCFSPLLRQVKVSPIAQQMLTVLVFSLLQRTLLYMTLGMVSAAPHTAAFWLPSLSTTVCWPLIVWLLRSSAKYSDRFHMT